MRGDDLTLHLGGEYRAGEHLRLRTGYQTTENRSLSAGLGLVAKHWIIDYAYLPFGSGLGDAPLAQPPVGKHKPLNFWRKNRDAGGAASSASSAPTPGPAH